VKNHVRDLLLREGQILPRGGKCWTQLGVAELEAMAQPLSQVGMNELWRGELAIELRQLRAVQAEIEVAEEKLDAIGAADPRVRLLRTIPGVGPRLAEAIVALLDRPERFRKASEVSAYIGMVPKELDSGETERRGKITRHGSRLVRSLLTQPVGAGNLSAHQWREEVAQEDRDCGRGQKITGPLLGYAARRDELAVAGSQSGLITG